jgi:hypothetical protein
MLRNLALLALALVTVPILSGLHKIGIVTDNGLEKMFDWFDKT